MWSEEHQRKDDAFLARHRARFEAALGALHDGLGKKNHTKRLDKVLQRLGRLRERYRRVHRQYDIEVQPGAKGLAAAIRWNRNDRHALHDAGAGSYALRTSHADWDLETVVRQYWRLTDLEATFRSLKSEMGLRPIWHSKSAQISAHLFIAVLAYHAVHLLRAPAGGARHSGQLVDDPQQAGRLGADHLDVAERRRRPHRDPPGCPARRRSPRYRRRPWPAAGGLAALCADAGQAELSHKRSANRTRDKIAAPCVAVG